MSKIFFDRFLHFSIVEKNDGYTIKEIGYNNDAKNEINFEVNQLGLEPIKSIYSAGFSVQHLSKAYFFSNKRFTFFCAYKQILIQKNGITGICNPFDLQIKENKKKMGLQNTSGKKICDCKIQTRKKM